jgi:hypothetical protein
MAAKRASETAKTQRVFGQRQELGKMFRVGLYARVSTHDQQTLPLQMRAMREYASKRGWMVAVQIKEVTRLDRASQTMSCAWRKPRSRSTNFPSMQFARPDTS